MEKTSLWEAPRPYFIIPANELIKTKVREYFVVLGPEGRRLRFGFAADPKKATENICRLPSPCRATFVAVAWDWGFPIVGECDGGMSPERAWEIGMSVHPEWQGTSLAVNLLRGQILYARAAGASTLEAMVTGGTPAKKFFKQNNFIFDSSATEDPSCPVFVRKMSPWWHPAY